MKSVKLSLVAALAASTFSVANAAPLEDVIKNIDVSGVLRYRYQAANGFEKSPFVTEMRPGFIKDKQRHHYKAQLNLNGAISDDFKAFIQFDYGSVDAGYGPNSLSDTSKTFNVRQLYLNYTNADTHTSVNLGRQQLNLIWTDNGISGLVGTGIKITNTSVDGLTLNTFAIDSFGTSTGFLVPKFQNNNSSVDKTHTKNLYGVALLGSYELMGGRIHPQLWLSYLDNAALFYATSLSYNTTLFNHINYNLEGNYLGNNLYGKIDRSTVSLMNQKKIDNGNLFNLRGSIKAHGWDASLGGIYYGKKDKITLNTLDDVGNLSLPGVQIFYTDGSFLNGDIGRNTFGYATAGYTFNETVRLGTDFVYGATQIKGDVKNLVSSSTKLETVARVDYKYSPKLSFSAFYSYLNADSKTKKDTDVNTVRLQALYRF